MKLLSVLGISNSGKTTTIENIISELISRNYSVGTIKEIHFEGFAIDTEGTNTYRHREAGAELVTARGYQETDFLYPEKLSLEKILEHYTQDFVLIEGIAEGNFPKIVTAKTTEEIDERIDATVFAISGRISEKIDEYRDLPVINGVTETEELVDLIEEKVYPRLPDLPEECCTACGYSCRELGKKILKGEADYRQCVVRRSKTKLYIDGKEIEMVPFVQKILKNAVKGVAKELDGYEENSQIKVVIGAVDDEDKQ